MGDTQERDRLVDEIAGYLMGRVNAPDPEIYKAAHGVIGLVGAEISRLRSELEKARIPEGWQIVPKEPTAEMIASGVTAGVGAAPEPWCPHAYRAMLSAAPQPPPSPEVLASSPPVPEQKD
jgi:hypothetical protein